MLNSLTATQQNLPALKGKTRMALLARISKQTDASTALERQLLDGFTHAAAEQLGFDPRKDYFADTASGYDPNAERPGLVTLEGALKRYKLVWVWRLDRIARRKEQIVAFVDACTRMGIRVVAPGDPYDSDVDTRSRLVKLAAHAEREARNTSERYRDQKTFAGDVGAYRGGSAPWGWRIAEPDERFPFKHLVLDHEAAHTVTLMGGGDPVTMTRQQILLYVIEQVLAGWKVNQLVSWLNRNRVPGGRGSEWQHKALDQKLFDRFRSAHLVGWSVRRDDAGEWELIYAPHADGSAERRPLVAGEALIDEATYARLQQAQPQRVPRQSAARDAQERPTPLLQGLVTCLAPALDSAVCGGVVTGPGNSTASTASYKCTRTGRHRLDPNRRQPMNTAVAHRMQEYVRAQIAEHTGVAVDTLGPEELRALIQAHIRGIGLRSAASVPREGGASYRFDGNRVVIWWKGLSDASCEQLAAKAAARWNGRAPGSLSCPECGEPYTLPSALGAHRRRAHGIRGGTATPHTAPAPSGPPA